MLYWTRACCLYLIIVCLDRHYIKYYFAKYALSFLKCLLWYALISIYIFLGRYGKIHCSQSVMWCEKGWKTIVHFWVCARSVWMRRHKTLYSSLHSWNVCQSLSWMNNSVYPHNNNVQQNPNCAHALQCKHGALHSCKTSASNFVYFQSALSA